MTNNTTQMTATTWVLIPLLVSTARASTYMDYVMCDANTTCPVGKYCFMDGQCKSCVSCEKDQKRQLPPPIDGISCAKTEPECGSCLPGYEEQSLTSSGRRRECSQIPTSSTSYQWNLSIIYIWLFVLSLLIVFIFREQLKKLICCCFYKKLPSTNLIRDPNSGNQSNRQSNSSLDERCMVLDGNNVCYQSQSVTTRQQNKID